MRRFWTMLAHWHGQLWNAAEFARSFGVSHTTVGRYLDLLTSHFVVRQVRPWFENVRKRQVRSPKVYIADSGILHALLDLNDRETLASHPKVGASWEGFVIQQIVHATGKRTEDYYHWSTYTGAELDLFAILGGHRYGFEIKRTSAPRLTPSMRSALETLELHRLYVVYPGDRQFRMAESVEALPVSRLLDELS